MKAKVSFICAGCGKEFTTEFPFSQYMDIGDVQDVDDLFVEAFNHEKECLKVRAEQIKNSVNYKSSYCCYNCRNFINGVCELYNFRVEPTGICKDFSTATHC